jgi:hypothetical protein
MLHIDTSAAGTHTILYSAIDQAGNTGTASRTVIVGNSSASETSSTPPVSSAANDNATMTLQKVGS